LSPSAVCLFRKNCAPKIAKTTIFEDGTLR
jgi:hypothetical protein